MKTTAALAARARHTLLVALAGGALVCPYRFVAADTAPEGPLSPVAMVATREGATLWVACSTGQRVLRFSARTRAVEASFRLPSAPSGVALSPDETRLYVTCAKPRSAVCVLSTANGEILDTLEAGHTAGAPVLSPDARTLYVCNRFDDDVSVIDLTARRERTRVRVRREPIAAALTSDGRLLLVANHLHDGRADTNRVAAVLSVLDTQQGKVVKELALPDGSGVLHDLRISPDGRYAVVTHLLGRYPLPTTQLERGWMNTNAKTLIDVGRMEVVNTVLLDSVDRGAANPWGVAWSADSARLVVAHAGTHELSVIQFPGVLARLRGLPAEAPAPSASVQAPFAALSQTDVPNDLAFLTGLRERLALPPTDRGPRAVVLVGTRAFVANYFSDTLATVDVAASHPVWESVPLGPRRSPDTVRQGEAYFHDATLCFQGWQSCASCHPGDGRVDALNWDLLNDGVGNPKNNKSLLLSHRTPPAMSMGIRETADSAIRAGLQHVLFTVQPDAVSVAMGEYLKALTPVPSPHRVDGQLTPSALRGRDIFTRAGCAVCHPPPLFTDLQAYHVGTRRTYDGPDDRFDTPTLIEVWRTAPYLHDGSAVTMREVLTTRNPLDEHGQTSRLSAREIEDLCAYVLSL